MNVPMVADARPLRTFVLAALAAAILVLVVPDIGAPASSSDETCSCTARHKAIAKRQELVLAERARQAAEEEEEATKAEASQSGDAAAATAAPEED